MFPWKLRRESKRIEKHCGRRTVILNRRQGESRKSCYNIRLKKVPRAPRARFRLQRRNNWSTRSIIRHSVRRCSRTRVRVHARASHTEKPPTASSGERVFPPMRSNYSAFVTSVSVPAKLSADRYFLATAADSFAVFHLPDGIFPRNLGNSDRENWEHVMLAEAGEESRQTWMLNLLAPKLLRYPTLSNALYIFVTASAVGFG